MNQQSKTGASLAPATPMGSPTTTPQTASISSENVLRLILDSIPGMVGLFTAEGVQLEVNSAPLISFGLTRDQVVGKYLWDAPWFDHDDTGVRERWKEMFRRVRSGECARRGRIFSESDCRIPD